jgi:hypothetical protein
VELVERLTAVLDQAAGRHRRIGVVASIVAVTAVTGAIQLLQLAVPVVGGLVIPALFVTITGVSAGGLALLFGLTALTLAPLARNGSLGRRSGAAIVVAYAVAALILVSGGA